MKYRSHRTSPSSRRSVFLYRWRTLSLFFLAFVLLITLCACKKVEKDPEPLPDLHGFANSVDTIGKGENEVVLHEVDPVEFLHDVGFWDMDDFRQAILYVSDDGSARLLVVEFYNENDYKEGRIKLAEKLGELKYVENCGGGIDEHDENYALVFFTAKCDHVTLQLWKNQMDRTWLIMLQSEN